MSRLSIQTTTLAGVKVVERQLLSDDRGHFSRLFCADELASDWPGPIAQVNESRTTRRGIVRGMHFQSSPFADAKLVTCVQGEVFDVALDLRAGSPSLLQWYGVHLSASNGRALLIPAGCAHGFQALTDDVRLIYCHSRHYTPSADTGVHPLEPRSGVEWPLPIADMSERDRQRPLLSSEFAGVQF